MLATVASSTSAGRIKRRLAELGIKSSVMQTPHQFTKDGCGYSLRFDEASKIIVEKEALSLGIRIRSFYSESEIDGIRNYQKI